MLIYEWILVNFPESDWLNAEFKEKQQQAANKKTKTRGPPVFLFNKSIKINETP